MPVVDASLLVAATTDAGSHPPLPQRAALLPTPGIHRQ